MENYVINPQVFYWINVFNHLQSLFAVIGGVSAGAFIGMVVAWAYNYTQAKNGYEDNENYMKVCKTGAIITGIIGFVLIMASVFIPGRTTSIEMLIAKTATFDNVNWSVQQVKDLVDHIVLAIKSI